MDHQPASTAAIRQPGPNRFWPWLLVLLVVLLVGGIRLRLLEIPLERDEGEYAYAGQLILQGIPPYELAYNMKLPGTYFAYALGMAVFGQTTAGVHLTLLAANSLTIVFVFLLGRKLLGVTAGLAACASYAVMSVSPAVLGLAAHATQFVVMFAVPATLLLWKAGEEKKNWALLGSGLLYGLALLMKQQGICFGIFGWIFLLWLAVGNRWTPAEIAKKSLVYGLGLILPVGLTCLVLAGAGVFARFWFWTFTYAAAYAAAEPLGRGLLLLRDYLTDEFRVYAGFAVLASSGLLVAGWNGVVRKQIIFVLGLLGFSWLGTAMGFYFREHYFVLLLPALAILVGLAVRSLSAVVPSRSLKSMPPLFLVAVLGWNLFLFRDIFFRLQPARVNEVFYPNNPFIEASAVAGYIREHSPANARIAVVGSEPEIYFYAQRHSATGYLYTYPLTEQQPHAAKMRREMIREIESARPEYLVWVEYQYSWMVMRPSALPIFDWFNKYATRNYDPVGIVSRLATGEISCLWDDAARNDDGSPGQCLLVFKRKPEAEIVPAAVTRP